MQTSYKITAVRQLLQPNVVISLELTNGYGIKVNLNVNDIANNPVLMGAMSKEDVVRVKNYLALLPENYCAAK